MVPMLISIHALREEGDPSGLGYAHNDIMHFYPRPPRGGRRWDKRVRAAAVDDHFYPRPPRGGRPPAQYAAGRNLAISIHALREEGDILLAITPGRKMPFLSTPSARRATKNPLSVVYLGCYFYPRPPRGGRPFVLWVTSVARSHFYPRPPRGGRLARSAAHITTARGFLSTPSARRATR